MNIFLDFEKPVADLEGKIEELRQKASGNGAEDAERNPPINVDEEIARLQAKAAQAVAELYAKLTPWQKTQVARHPARPHFSDYVSHLIADFTPLAGDRLYGEDKAIVTGLGRFHGR